MCVFNIWQQEAFKFVDYNILKSYFSIIHNLHVTPFKNGTDDARKLV